MPTGCTAATSCFAHVVTMKFGEAPVVTPRRHVPGSTTVGVIRLVLVQVVFTNGVVVPAFAVHDAGAEKLVALFAPAGLLQIFVIQLGEVPAVVPTVPQPAAVVNTVVLLAPGGRLHSVWTKLGLALTLGVQVWTGVTAETLISVHVVTMKFGEALVVVPAVHVVGSILAVGKIVVGVQVTLVNGEVVPGLFVHVATNAVVSVGFVHVVVTQFGAPEDVVPTVHAAELVAAWLFAPAGLLQVVVIQFGLPEDVVPS